MNTFSIKELNINSVTIGCGDDGRIIRKKTNGVSQSRQFGSLNLDGYRQVMVNRKTFPVHRLIAMAFLDDYSKELQVDHINGDKCDNRVENLRMVTPMENQRSYRKGASGVSSRFRGVSLIKSRGLWMTSISNGSKNIRVGEYASEEAAALAYNEAATALGYDQAALNTVTVGSSK